MELTSCLLLYPAGCGGLPPPLVGSGARWLGWYLRYKDVGGISVGRKGDDGGPHGCSFVCCHFYGGNFSGLCDGSPVLARAGGSQVAGGGGGEGFTCRVGIITEIQGRGCDYQIIGRIGFEDVSGGGLDGVKGVLPYFAVCGGIAFFYGYDAVFKE